MHSHVVSNAASFAEYGSGSQIWQPQDTGVHDWWAGWSSCPQLQSELSSDTSTTCVTHSLHPQACCAAALGSNSSEKQMFPVTRHATMHCVHSLTDVDFAKKSC